MSGFDFDTRLLAGVGRRLEVSGERGGLIDRWGPMLFDPVAGAVCEGGWLRLSRCYL